MALVDELHVVTDDTFEAISARAGKRDRSLLLAISTPPKAGEDGVMRRLVDHGREGTDPSFSFTEFAALAGCAVDDEAAWTIANPALDDFLHRDALRATLPPKMRHEEHPRRARGGGQVPIVDVENAIRSACRCWRVLEIVADPFRWAGSLQLLDGEGLPVLEYRQSPGRMAPATARF